MRQIGTLPKTLDHKVFTDYLLTLGIKSRIDEQPEGWSLWIYNEDHVEQARVQLQNYLSRPDDPLYRDAVEAALAIRRQEQQLDQQFRKNYREVTDLWAYPGLRRRPLILALVAVSLVVFVLLESPNYASVVHNGLSFSTSYIDLEGRERSNGSNNILHGEVWRLVTPIFLHFGILHLLMNVLALSSFGSLIEIRRGTLRLAGLVLIAAVVSNLGQYLYMERVDPGEPQSFGGISGVICALFGYIWIKGLYEPEQGMILHPNSVTFILIYLALCMTGVMGPIANAAHVVGLIVGVAFGVLRF
ncbi:MAG: rhomboid family intramembrane serine protease [Isosphaerales bacterium]